MGLRVPQDISLIGYDNVRNARYFSPALTTIHQPKDSLGEAAFNMLLDRIVNKREESSSSKCTPRLVERRSVADGPFVVLSSLRHLAGADLSGARSHPRFSVSLSPR
ncbi:substrate-binding domain-containing protein [Klebsiella pneumoniae subsp. pneumoniae]|nr:substrate-binding domain-containing protein [Klebsiella pneumoniae subsp. pneumoniae]